MSSPDRTKALRDLLQPGVNYALAGRGIKGRAPMMQENVATGNLEITLDGRPRVLVTAAEIADDTYRDAFKMRLQALADK